MSNYYDKNKLKEQLELDNIYDLLVELGGEPEYTTFGLVSQTICHNYPNEGSRKLYYYENSNLFKCYTDCDDTFDVFDLVIKAIGIQKKINWELYDAMNFIAQFFGFEGAEPPSEKLLLKDWEIFKRYEKSHHSNRTQTSFEGNPIKEIDKEILNKFAYPRIIPWEKEGISRETCIRNFIGYYPGGEQITIPHFNMDNKLIGIRGRALVELDGERYGKYRPIYMNKTLYNHPLSVNLYNLNNSKDNIRKSKSAIVFESEKSALLFQTYYGIDNDISTACCGSSITNHQINLLEQLNIKELIIAFDRQFTNIGDNEFKKLKNKILNINKKYGNRIKISAIFDKEMITSYKASPIDEGKEKFEYLLQNRIKNF